MPGSCNLPGGRLLAKWAAGFILEVGVSRTQNGLARMVRWSVVRGLSLCGGREEGYKGRHMMIVGLNISSAKAEIWLLVKGGQGSQVEVEVRRLRESDGR